jgi:hypothetical protein
MMDVSVLCFSSYSCHVSYLGNAEKGEKRIKKQQRRILYKATSLQIYINFILYTFRSFVPFKVLRQFFVKLQPTSLCFGASRSFNLTAVHYVTIQP